MCYVTILQQLCLVFGAFAISFGLDQICSASFSACISILNLFQLSVDFFFFPPPSFVEGGGEAQENPEVLIIDYFFAVVVGVYYCHYRDF